MTKEKAVAVKMLSAERDNVRSVRAALQDAVAQVLGRVSLATSYDDRVDPRAGMRAVLIAIPLLTASLTDALRFARDNARSEGRDSIGIDLEDVDGAPVSTDEDDARAAMAASAFASYWGAVALERVKRAAPRRMATGTGVRQAIQASVRDTASRLERVTVTETVHAFNDERQIAAKQLVAKPANDVGGPFRIGARPADEGEPTYVKIWSALLDGATCGRCAALNGREVAIDDAFPEGAEPPLHPFCRCIVIYDRRSVRRPRAA